MRQESQYLLEKWIIAVSVVILLAVGVYAVLSRGQVITKATPSNLSAGLAAIGDRVTAELKPAEGQSGSGQVILERSGDDSVLTVTTVLPDLPERAFYQVWFTPVGGDTTKPGRLGRLSIDATCGCWTSRDHLSLDPPSVATVRITREETDDEESEMTILESTLLSQSQEGL